MSIWIVWLILAACVTLGFCILALAALLFDKRVARGFSRRKKP